MNWTLLIVVALWVLSLWASYRLGFATGYCDGFDSGLMLSEDVDG